MKSIVGKIFGEVMRTFGIDKAAGNIIKSIGLFISDICVSMVTFALELINFVFNSSINAIKTEVAIRPEVFDGTMVETLRTISENTILPIAGLIITYVFAYEIYENQNLPRLYNAFTRCTFTLVLKRYYLIFL